MLERLALYSTLGLVLDLIGQTWQGAGFWCIIALFIANEWLTRTQLIEELNEELQAMRRRRQQESEEAPNEHRD